MILNRHNLGITMLTPQYVEKSARLATGMRFGVNGLGTIDPTLDPSSMTLQDITTALQQGLIAFNAQQVFEINLDRLQRGLPPIPTQYASPSFNLGIAGVSSTALLIGAGLLLLVLLRR